MTAHSLHPYRNSRILRYVHHHSSSCKYPLLWVIWSLRCLRHIYLKPGCYLLNAQELPQRLPRLLNLQTVEGIRNFEWTKGIMGKIPNLKKLGISYDFSSSANWSTYQLENLVYLEKLEGLKINVKYDDLGLAMPHDTPKIAFPQKLKKLSLSGCRIPWESMAAIGALPNLEALKLRCNAFFGPE